MPQQLEAMVPTSRQKGRAVRRREIELQPARIRLAGEEFLEDHGLRSDLGGGVAADEGGYLVAKGEEAGGLEPDDRQAPLRIGR